MKAYFFFFFNYKAFLQFSSKVKLDAQISQVENSHLHKDHVDLMGFLSQQQLILLLLPACALWFQPQQRLLAKQTCGTSNTGWDLCLIQLLFCSLKLDQVLCEDQRKSQRGLAALCCLPGLHRKAMLTGSLSFKMPTCQYCLKEGTMMLWIQKKFSPLRSMKQHYQQSWKCKHVIIPASNHTELCTGGKTSVSCPSAEVGQIHLPCFLARSKT